MKIIKKTLFPVLLILTCISVYFWQHYFALLTYLPNNVITPIAVLTPAVLILTFFTTFTLMKQTERNRPVLRSFGSTAVILLFLLIAGRHMLNLAARRFAGIMPVLVLPEFPTGHIMMIVTILCVVHLSVLLAIRLRSEEAGALHKVLSVIGWFLLNIFLLLTAT